MAGRFERSFELTRASFSALQKNPRLLVFPLLSGGATLLAAASFILPVVLFVLSAPDKGTLESANMQLVGFLGAFCFYLATTFVTVFFNAALIHAAMRALDGQDTTVGQALGFAAGRIGPILGYSVFAAVVSTVLKQIEERVGLVGRIIVGLIGVGWSLATFLAVPVLVMEGTGPIETVKRSAKLFKDTWGEQVLGRLGYGLVGFLVMLAVMGTLVAGVFFGITAGWALGAPILAFGVLLLAMWILVMTTLNSVWTAALYRYATTGEVAQGFPSHHFPRRG